MKITKGVKLTEEQKAQRVESRRKTEERSLQMAAEYHAHQTRQNALFGEIQYCWFTISRAERAALDWVYKECVGKPLFGSSNEFTRLVIDCLLARPTVAVGMIQTFIRYRDAEDFGSRGNELALARIVQCPEYAFRNKRPLLLPYAFPLFLEMRRVERRALLWILRRVVGNSESAYPEVARWILQHALAHPKTTVEMVLEFLSYKNAEGFDWRGEKELALSFIARCPDYVEARP